MSSKPFNKTQRWQLVCACKNPFLLIAKPNRNVGSTKVVETEPENAAFKLPGETVLDAFKRRMFAQRKPKQETAREKAEKQFNQLFGRREEL